MTGPYTHRNGETDAPTEYGLYLARHMHGFPMFVQFYPNGDVDEFDIPGDGWEIELNNPYFAGVRWWGPISLPENFNEAVDA